MNESITSEIRRQFCFQRICRRNWFSPEIVWRNQFCPGPGITNIGTSEHIYLRMDASGRRERRRCRRSRQRAVDKEQWIKSRGIAPRRQRERQQMIQRMTQRKMQWTTQRMVPLPRVNSSEVSQLGLSVESSRSIQIAIKIIVSTVARLLNNVSYYIYCRLIIVYIVHSYITHISKDLLEELCNTSSRSFGALSS